MQSLYILIPIAAIFVICGISFFIWSVDSQQFEDLDREASRILEDDE
ncbi:MAG: cbb3-type cytochrome oxidase assembly protein CcoS [Cellvibrionales bacterium]|nr:cbb3-type cytochrome oxidase assembly protein CcoS [Cellvibrionales bacterium]